MFFHSFIIYEILRASLLVTFNKYACRNINRAEKILSYHIAHKIRF